jgi:hypothetical protein
MASETLSLLKSHAQLITNNKEHIARAWMEDNDVQRVFKRFSIPRNPFMVNFGIPIIDYFISVISGIQRPGDCPIMTKLVKYLITKHIAPKEVFIICMGLRKELMSFLLDHEQDTSRLNPMLMQTSGLFNENLAGVLELFEHHLAQSRQKLGDYDKDISAFRLVSGLISNMDACVAVLKHDELLFANRSFLELFSLDSVNDFNLAYCEAEQTWNFMRSCDYGQEILEAGNYSEWAAQLAETKAPCLMEVELHSGLMDLSVRTAASTDETYVITLTDIGYHLEKTDKAFEEVKAEEEAMEQRIKELAKSTLPAPAPLDGSGLTPPEEYEQDIRVQQAQQTGRDFIALLIKTDPESLDKIQPAIIKRLKPLLPEDALLSQIDSEHFSGCWQRSDRSGLLERFTKLEKTIEELALPASVTLFRETVHPKRAIVTCMELLDSVSEGEDGCLATDIEEVLDARAAIRDHETIFGTLQGLNTIETAIFHQQVPVYASNILVKISEASVHFDMTPKQLNTVKAGMPIHFELQGIGFVKGMCDKVDRKRRKMEVTDICKNPNSPLLRKSIRVKALPGMKATLAKGDVTLEAEMLDCSSNSVGLKLTKLRKLAEGDSVEFFALFPLHEGEHEQISTTATITKIIKKDGFIVVCDFGAHQGATRVLRQFASARQLDVVRDIGAGKKAPRNK